MAAKSLRAHLPAGCIPFPSLFQSAKASNNSQASIVRHHTSIVTTRRSTCGYRRIHHSCTQASLMCVKTVNCDNAFEVGCIAASAMTNGYFSDVKLKRNDKVKTIASMANTVTIRNERVTINPDVLFSRITCILRDSSEMEVYLSYELAPQPPSLFQDGLMRKSLKSA